MTPIQQHIIKRQIFELDVPPEQGNFQLQQRVETWFEEKVLPKLDLLFSELLPQDRYLEIEQLEIDLGDIDINTFETNFADQYLHAIRKEIEDQIHKATFQPKTTNKWSTNQERWIETFSHFLQTGTFPWWQSTVPAVTFEQHLQVALQQQSNLFANRMPSLLAGSLKMNQRLVKQFSEPFIQTLFNHIDPQLYPQFVYYHNTLQILLKAITRQHPSFQLSSTLLKSTILYAIFRSTDASHLVDKRLSIILHQICKLSSTISYSNLLQAILREIETSSLQQALNQVSSPTLEKTIFKEIEQLIVSENRTDFSKKKKSVMEAIEEIEESIIGEQEGYYIDNAGLILTAPFLPPLFKTLGLLDGQQFKDQDAAERALHLLQYMVSPTPQAPEYLLVLNKLLCGIPLNQPVAKDIEINQTEKEEIQQLLKAMVGHWKALKNSTPAGLQETFIQRVGKLSFQEESSGWLLQIEQKSMDILLSAIPWSYSVVKLPWMPDMLRVDWA